MKQRCFFPIVLMMVAAFTACTEKLDVQNMDPHIQANLAIALPVGELSATVGDFLGNSGIYYREDGVLYWQDTLKIQRQFHLIELNKYYSSVTKDMKLTSLPEYQGITDIVGDNTTHILSFPLTLKFSNINEVFTDERIDSAYIATASFISSIQENFGLNPSYIRSIELRLPSQFHRPAGNVISIPVEDFAYGKDIRITVDEFVLDFMKDHGAEPSNENVTNTVTFTINFYVRIPEGETIAINDESAFTYHFAIDFLDFVAMWGRFQPGKDMEDNTEMMIDTIWPAWKQIRDLHLPLAEPNIDIHIESEIGAPLTLHLDHLYVKELATSEECYATFDGNKQWNKVLTNFVKTDDPLGKREENIIILNNQPSNGQIEQLLTIRPDVVGYQYTIYINDDYYYTKNYPQHRLTNNTQLGINAVVTLPFVFNKGLEISYSDTLKDVKIDQISLDSLLKDVPEIENIETKELSLVLTAENYIPFDADLTLRFLDGNGAVLDFSNVIEDSKLHVAGPTSYTAEGTISKPGVSHKTISLTQENLNKLTQIKQIIYTAALSDVDEKALTNNAVVYPVKIRNTSSLNLKIAIAADVEAYLALPLKDNK